jgi:general secretion pathway protein A
MTKHLRNTLCDHAAGNYRIFIGMAAELLMTAAQREITELDEKLYLQVFGARSAGDSNPAPCRGSLTTREMTAALKPRSRSPMAHHRS